MIGMEGSRTLLDDAGEELAQWGLNRFPREDEGKYVLVFTFIRC